MKIIMDPDSLIQSSIGDNITATIYFDFGEYQFPSEDWNDFASVILNWWIREIDSAINCSNHLNSSFKLLFMDGPFYMKCMFISENLIRLTCLEDRGHEIVRFDEICDIYDLQKEVQRTTKKFVNAAHQKKITNNDVELLHKHVYSK